MYLKKLNPKSMKSENKRMILRYLIENGSQSRMDIVRKTKLAQSAVWRITEELIEEGLLEISTRRKRATIVAPTKSFMTAVVFNVEVSETTVAMGFLNGSWKVVKRFSTPKVFEEFKEEVRSSLQEAIKIQQVVDGKLPKLVFSLPGMVNNEKAFLIHAPNIGWKHIDFRKEFEDLGMEILADNDSNLSLLAELFFSQDVKKSKTSFFLYLSEGVGGAISLNRNIARGENFAAGEIGHVIIDLNGSREVEEFLSISKLIERVEKLVQLKGKTPKEKFHHLLHLWLLGDHGVKKVVEEYLRHLAVVLRNIIYFLNPGVIILGGLVNNLWETFGFFVKTELQKITDEEIAKVIIRDTVFKEVSPSLVGGNVLAIESFLKSVN
ncbi:ROK family protein [Pseudothermotoga thermarum]|uniref:ROK family protein n=1 Tax=Pseudothermotoga thermarum DSM 5069 TaxID=688269 RepID=F7YVS5_9THEM|nr:ROK family protein [Pseudothermotoga thermarum]AEH51745.1 ROK family protein [Pseudothermotoga thermarum DSM 5069]